jgi:hypothetical protein
MSSTLVFSSVGLQNSHNIPKTPSFFQKSWFYNSKNQLGISRKYRTLQLGFLENLGILGKLPLFCNPTFQPVPPPLDIADFMRAVLLMYH